MKNVFKKIDGVKTGIFAAGVLFGTAGIKILASDDAKKLYSRKEPFGKRPGGCFSHQRLCEESVGERRGLRQRRPAVGKRHPEP